jgi:ABC-type dipeptide/oligopeptide/nickel transport system permease subunit
MATMIGAAAGAEPRRSNLGRVVRRFLKNRAAIVGGTIVLSFIVVAVLAPQIAPFDPIKTNFLAVRKPPSALYWLGTDELGRDLLSRLIYGARASLMAGVVSVGIAVLIGVPIGMLSGYAGGWFDTIVMRINDAILAIPFLILAIALAAFLGPSLTNAMIAIGFSSAPIFARLARGQTLAVKVDEYIEAARCIGAPHWVIVVRHILPNILPPILVQITLASAAAILAEAGLSFLGLGQQPPSPSWGKMLDTARAFLSQAPWMSIFPGVCIFLAVFGFNLLGDGLHDALDPKEH